MTTELIPNIPRAYTALAEWLACVIFIFPLLKRPRWPLILGLMGLGQYALQLFVENWPLFLWIPGMIINIFWMFLTILFTCQLSLKQAGYLCGKAFIIAEFTASLAWQLYCQFIVNRLDTGSLFVLAFMLVSYLIIFSFFFLLEKNMGHADVIKNFRPKDILLVFFTASIIFAMSNIGCTLSSTSFDVGDSISIFFSRTLVNFSGVCILFMQENQKYEDYLKEEITAVNSIFQLQYEQYVAYKESSGIINQKFHDLKHQIETIRNETNLDKRTQYLDEMSLAINQFSSNISTGNGILDTILTRKNTYCISQNITFTCIVDGELLNFIDTMDICSLFGNALDNAIESALKMTDLEKRLINLRVFKSGQFIMISFENYCLETVIFDEGLPQTTKKNKDYHGYGIKSIAYIAEKYQGTMTLSFKDNWFKLKVLLPIETH